MDYEAAWNELRGYIQARGSSLSVDAILGEMDFIEEQNKGKYSVIDNITGRTVRGDLTEDQANGLCYGLNLDAGPGGRYGVRPLPEWMRMPESWD